MKNLHAIIIILAFSISSAFAGSSIEKLNIDNATPENVKTLVTANWDKVLKRCPGLTKYSSDMKYEKLDDMSNPAWGEMSRVEVKFLISNNPQLIPNEFGASGHTCGFGIGADGRTLRIQKNTCASVCLDKQFTQDWDYFVSISPDISDADLAFTFYLAHSGNEPKINEAMWAEADRSLYVMVEDDGSNRSGYAEYLCLLAGQKGITVKTINIFDTMKFLISGNFSKIKKIGTANCPNK
jgi:hypothetical protein